jgi:anti-sigma B factor antagonist
VSARRDAAELIAADPGGQRMSRTGLENPLSFEVSTVTCGTTHTVTVVGELDLAVVGRLDAHVDDAFRDAESVVIDLSGAHFIDSSGIHALVRAHRRAERRSVPFAIVPAPGPVHRVFRICGMDSHLPFAETRCIR